jgi:hypothetical protein
MMRNAECVGLMLRLADAGSLIEPIFGATM